jgi:hypothetical protein
MPILLRKLVDYYSCPAHVLFFILRRLLHLSIVVGHANYFSFAILTPGVMMLSRDAILRKERSGLRQKPFRLRSGFSLALLGFG